MRRRRIKANRERPSAQLDLFATTQTSAPLDRVLPPTASPTIRSQRPALGNPASLSTLVQYVLGPSRKRGRPEKQLTIGSPSDSYRLLDVREAAHRLGLSKSTLDKMRCSGRGPRFIRATERAIRYDPKDLDAFAAERRRESTSHDPASLRRMAVTLNP